MMTDKMKETPVIAKAFKLLKQWYAMEWRNTELIHSRDEWEQLTGRQVTLYNQTREVRDYLLAEGYSKLQVDNWLREPQIWLDNKSPIEGLADGQYERVMSGVRAVELL